MGLELNWHIQGTEDVLDTSRNLRADTIAREKHDFGPAGGEGVEGSESFG